MKSNSTDIQIYLILEAELLTSNACVHWMILCMLHFIINCEHNVNGDQT